MHLFTIAVFVLGAAFIIAGLLFMRAAVPPYGPFYASVFKPFIAPRRTLPAGSIRSVIDDERLWYPVSRKCGPYYVGLGAVMLAVGIPSYLVGSLHDHWQSIALGLIALAVLGSNAIVELAFRATNDLIRQMHQDAS
jgi:hypothetical protein